MADTFTKDKWELLDDAYDDPDISSVEFEVAYGLIKWLNRKKGYAWPGIKLLADAIHGEKAVATRDGVTGTGKTVRRALDKLVASGYFNRQRGGGGEPTRYFPTTRKARIAAKEKANRPDTTVRSDDDFRRDIGENADGTFEGGLTGHLKNGRPDTGVPSDDDENDAIINDDQYDESNFDEREFVETENDNPLMNTLRPETIVSGQPYEGSTSWQIPAVGTSKRRAVEGAASSTTAPVSATLPASADEECVAAARTAEAQEAFEDFERHMPVFDPDMYDEDDEPAADDYNEEHP